MVTCRSVGNTHGIALSCWRALSGRQPTRCPAQRHWSILFGTLVHFVCLVRPFNGCVLAVIACGGLRAKTSHEFRVEIPSRASRRAEGTAVEQPRAWVRCPSHPGDADRATMGVGQQRLLEHNQIANAPRCTWRKKMVGQASTRAWERRCNNHQRSTLKP